MPKVFHCSNCSLQHERPVGKKCQYIDQGESLPSDVEVAAPPSSDIRASEQILLQLQLLGEKMDSMDKRVQRTEAALGQGNSQAGQIASNASVIKSSTTVAHSNATEEVSSESVVPSVEFLRQNDNLQSEVEKRLAELRSLNESASRGRVKSQRGGPGEISVKKAVDWPQNFILTGTNKTRPTYDDLSITQWVAGFIRCIQEEKLECNRASMLDYLGNLMEDASDFSWEAAKASHAILLTNMEGDRIKWGDTDKIDRIRRAHAQRHVNPQSSAPRPFNKKPKVVSNKNGLICKFFQEGTCKFPNSHRSAGQYYRHVCEFCEGPHVSKSCSQKQNSKN